jgi:hypothetical protein
MSKFDAYKRLECERPLSLSLSTLKKAKEDFRTPNASRNKISLVYKIKNLSLIKQLK